MIVSGKNFLLLTLSTSDFFHNFDFFDNFGNSKEFHTVLTSIKTSSVAKKVLKIPLLGNCLFDLFTAVDIWY